MPRSEPKYFGFGEVIVRGGGRGYQNGGPLFANLAPRLSLFSDPLRTVLAVKGSLRRAQQRRALDRSGPFRTTLLRNSFPEPFNSASYAAGFSSMGTSL